MFDEDRLPWHTQPWQHLLTQWQSQRLGHAWLLSGLAGSGKLHLARRFAALLFCREPRDNEACRSCRECTLFNAGSHPDWRLLQPEKKVITVDQVRESMDFAFGRSQREGYKVLCLHPAEAMNVNAANALLKLLEEPPPMTLLFLLSHQGGLLLPTLRSRCQKLQVPLPETTLAIEWLRARGCADAEEVLLRAGGAPLQALALAEAGRLQEHATVQSRVAEVLAGRSTPVAAAARCGKLAVPDILEHQLQDVAMLIRACQADTPLPGSGVRALQELLPRGGQDRASHRALHRLLQGLQSCRTTALASNNANPQMILEQAFGEWSTLGRAVAGAGTRRHG
jgi:DNA polymerase-3 subunit delta'